MMIAMDKQQKRLWSNTAEIPQFPALHGDARTDVLIVGGGAAGLLTAYFLKKRGVDCIVAEGDRILSGATGGTTAKITAQHGLIYNKLTKTFGYEKARLYFEANRRAAEMFKELSGTFPCDYEEKPNYVYLRDDRRSFLCLLRQRVRSIFRIRLSLIPLCFFRSLQKSLIFTKKHL